MSLSDWTSDDINTYARLVRVAMQQEEEMKRRKESWLKRFREGKPVEQYDEYIKGGNYEISRRDKIQNKGEKET